MSSAERVARGLDSIPTVQLPVATYVSTNSDGTVVLDFGQGSVTCLSAGWFTPLPGDSVRCLRADEATVMLGPAQPRSGVGTVTATGTPTLTVTTSAGSRQLPFISTYSAVVSDTVLIDWASGGVVVGKVTAAPSSSYTPADAPMGSFSADFRADDSGSYQSGSWWTSDVWCSDTNIGAWFYGSTIADTIPDAATITSVQVYVNEFYNAFPTSLATVGLHALATKAGAPTVTSEVTVSAGSGWKTLPAAFGDALKTGVSRGVGTDHGGYHKWRSRAADADSGLLRIGWSV